MALTSTQVLDITLAGALMAMGLPKTIRAWDNYGPLTYPIADSSGALTGARMMYLVHEPYGRRSSGFHHAIDLAPVIEDLSAAQEFLKAELMKFQHWLAMYVYC